MGKYSEFILEQNLRKERYAKKITMAEMSKLLGKKSESSYHNIEKGNVEPKITDMNKISEILQMPVQYFFKIKVQES